jgi:hypothetical protein
VIDSGATHHFVRDPADVSDYREDSQLVVQLADNSTITTTGVGCIPGKLAEVHVSPEFDSNLLSVPCLYKDGKAVLFHPKVGVIVCNQADLKFQCEDLLAQGTFRNDAFHLEVRRPAGSGSSRAAVGSDKSAVRQSAQRWLSRLGYTYPDRILYAQKHGLAEGVDLAPGTQVADFAVDHVDAYVQSRAKDYRHVSTFGKKRSTKPFEFLHMDTKIANVRSYSGYQYFAVVVDDFTRWRAVLPLKTKDALVETFRRWHQQFVVRTVGANVTKTIRCDNGGEQKNYKFDKFLTDIAAHVQFTNVYSSASNGVAERAIQDIMNGSTGLLIGSGFADDKRPWLEFAMTYVYITNRLPTSANPNCASPYQMLYGEVPNLSHLRTIGCKVHVLIPKERRRAFDSKTRMRQLPMGIVCCWIRRLEKPSSLLLLLSSRM